MSYFGCHDITFYAIFIYPKVLHSFLRVLGIPRIKPGVALLDRKQLILKKNEFLDAREASRGESNILPRVSIISACGGFNFKIRLYLFTEPTRNTEKASVKRLGRVPALELSGHLSSGLTLCTENGRKPPSQHSIILAVVDSDGRAPLQHSELLFYSGRGASVSRCTDGKRGRGAKTRTRTRSGVAITFQDSKRGRIDGAIVVDIVAMNNLKLILAAIVQIEIGASRNREIDGQTCFYPDTMIDGKDTPYYTFGMYCDGIKLNSLVREQLREKFAESARCGRARAFTSKYGQNISKYNTRIDNSKNAIKSIDSRNFKLYLLKKASSSKVISQQVSLKMKMCNIRLKEVGIVIRLAVDATDEPDKLLEAPLINNTERPNERTIKEIKHSTDETISDFVQQAADIERSIAVCADTGRCLADCTGTLKLSETVPADRSALALVFIGTTQIIFGAAFIFTPGASPLLATTFVTEGIGDIATGVRRHRAGAGAGRAGDFGWSSWATLKLIHFTICGATSGSGIIRSAAGAASSDFVHFKLFFLTETVKTGWNIVAKKICTQLGKSVVNRFVPKMINYGLEKTIEPLMLKKITKMIEGPILEAIMNNRSVEKMLQLDEKNDNDANENYLKIKAVEILNLKNWNRPPRLALQVVSAVADNKAKGFFEQRSVIEALELLIELQNFVPHFIEKMNSFLNNVIDSQELKESRDDDTSLRMQIEIQKTSRRLAEELVNNVAIDILNIIKHRIISPIVRAGVAAWVSELTSGLDRSLDGQIISYQSLLRIIGLQNAGFKGLHEANGSRNNNYRPDKKDVEKVESLIKDAEFGPCGLPHLGALSDVVSRPIQVYDERQRLKYVIGDEKAGEPIRVQFHKPTLGQGIGHFTLIGGKEPFPEDGGENMCLFNTVALQTGAEPRRLKTDTLSFIKQYKIEFSKQIDDLIRLERENNFSLNLGGASYHGTSSSDAGKYLDESQGVVGFGYRNPGHPRNHASDPTKAANVENYSRQGYKSGFDSYEIQNTVTHNALQTRKAREAMDTLNQYDSSYRNGENFKRQVVHITREDFQSSGLELPDTATGGQWVNGNKTSSWNVDTVTVVLQHHDGQETNPDAPVHVQTIYPRDR